MKPEKTAYLGLPATGDGSIAGRVTGFERWLLRQLLRGFGDPPIFIRAWDGSRVAPEGTTPRCGMVLCDRGALWRLISHPMLHFGDDFSTGRIEVEGDLVEFLEAIFVCRLRLRCHNPPRRPLLERLRRVRSNNLHGSRENIHHHYDIGNSFYRLWLDEEMQYTCAYFPDPEMTLEAAQRAKLDHVCRKLRLQPGESVVEAGCGWGGLARHMARHYGVRVRAYNISAEQVAYARERAAAEGLAGQIDYVLDDYRTIRGQFDAFVSVGMLEHVGTEHYAELGAVIDRCLTPDGRGLIHSIGQNQAISMSAWAERRIFPGAYPPTLREMMEIFEPSGLSILDVENLRLHYARTLAHWLSRFDVHSEEIRTMFDETFVRAWRLYLASAIANFTSGNLQLFQVLFARPLQNDLPWSRAHLYSERRDD